MYIAYYDECGDDGFPKYSSPLFALTAVYIHYLKWQGIYEKIRLFRRTLKNQFGLPIRLEMHAKYFLLNKNPYRELQISDQNRIQILDLYIRLIGNLDLKIINVVIDKPKIQKPDYDVLDTSLKYSIQRVENTLAARKDNNDRFMIITDEGRVGKMRSIARAMQSINFIPSKFSPNPYRSDIKLLIEDPLPKDSRESYFIQLADLVAFVVYQHSLTTTGSGPLSNRVAHQINERKVKEWMEYLKPVLNLKASQDEFGIVYHPK